MSHKKSPVESSYQKALEWIRKYTLPEKGIVVSSKQRLPYLEITGYLIPTLIEAKEFNLAQQYAEFLCFMQRPNGSFAGPDGKEYVFDSGQALRGLVRMAARVEKYKPFARKTADYLCLSMDKNGRIPATYTDPIPEAVHVFVLPALLEAAVVLKEPRYKEATLKSVEFYKSATGALDKKYLTHFLAYIIDGFIDMGESDFVRNFVSEFFKGQRKDGSIPAYPKVSWTCSVGVAQWAIIAYKLGLKERADRALNWLIRYQNPTGGFFGSYGVGAKYFPKEEISWVNKFFLDALHLKGGLSKNPKKEIIPLNDSEWHETIIEENVDELAQRIRKNDFPIWVKPLLMHTKPGDSVLELGSGAGKLAAILSVYARKAHLLDYSKKNIDYAKALFKKMGLNAHFHVGDILENLPLETSSVDWVYSSGVLEHFSDGEIIKIMKESARVARKGVLSLVPNAHSIMYRIGKHKLERENKWTYGREIPKFSMKQYFTETGFKNIEEYSVGNYHALQFWGGQFLAIKDFFDTLPADEVAQLNQGYLLFTYGEKNG